MKKPKKQKNNSQPKFEAVTTLTPYPCELTLRLAAFDSQDTGARTTYHPEDGSQLVEFPFPAEDDDRAEDDEKSRVGVVVHESAHVVQNVEAYIGERLSSGAEAYLLQHVVVSMLDALEHLYDNYREWEAAAGARFAEARRKRLEKESKK